MDSKTFDSLVRSLHSRRSLVGAMVGAGLGFTALHAPASARKHKKHKSWKTFGCTDQQDACAGADVPCPGAPPGAMSFCLATRKGKPVCAGDAVCVSCASDADCAQFGRGAKCFDCAGCVLEGSLTMCAMPFKVLE